MKTYCWGAFTDLHKFENLARVAIIDAFATETKIKLGADIKIQSAMQNMAGMFASVVISDQKRDHNSNLIHAKTCVMFNVNGLEIIIYFTDIK